MTGMCDECKKTIIPESPKNGCLSGAVLPFIKKQLLYNKKFPISELLVKIDKNDPRFVDSAYDNLIAPVIEEIVFALVPLLLFPGSILVFVCFRIGFILLHTLEKNSFGRLSVKGLSINKLFIPVLVSLVAVVSQRFDVSLGFHILMNAFVTPLLNKYSSVTFLKAAIRVTGRLGQGEVR